MKKKFWLHVLAIALACSAACFVGCNKGPVADDGEHTTHTYQKHERVESTCVTAGTDEYYTCDGCELVFVKNGEEYTEVTDLTTLALPLADHDFTSITLDTSLANVEYTAYDVFDLTGLKVTKVCGTSGCAGVKAADSEISFEYATSGATCLTADMTKVIIKVGDLKADLNVTVNKKVIALPSITDKVYTGETLVADLTDTDDYTVTTNNGGATVGAYDVVLTLKDSANCVFEGVEGATATLKFNVLKQNNVITMPASIADVFCHKTPAVEATALEGEVTYLFSDEQDGEYLPLSDWSDGALEAGTWYVKATVAETDNYSATTSDALSFKVVHGLGGYTVGASEDTPACACGEAVEGEAFKTLVSGTQYLQTTDFATDMAKLQLDGVDATKIATYGNFSCDDLDLGTSSAPNVANVATLIAGTRGAKTLNLAVTDVDGFDHVVKIPVVVVTEVITSWNQLLCCVARYDGAPTKYREGEYYVLGNDIVGSNPENGFTLADGTTKKAVHCESGTGSIESADYVLGGGFAGTLDGAGHTISKIDFAGVSIFGTLNCGTVKNINLTGKIYSWARSVFGGAGHVFGATIENVTLTFEEGSCTDFTLSEANANRMKGIFAENQMAKTTLKNVTIHAEGISFRNIISQGALGSDINNANKVNTNTMENVKVYCKDYQGITFHSATTQSQFTSGGGQLTVYTEVQNVDLSAETFSLTIPTALTLQNYSYYTVRIDGNKDMAISAKLSDEEVASATDSLKWDGLYWAPFDFSNISSETVKALLGDNLGEHEIVFNIAGKGANNTYAWHSCVLRVNFTDSSVSADPAE